MKFYEILVKMKVPETRNECEELINEKGDCPGCAYNLEDKLQPCQHQKILDVKQDIDKNKQINKYRME